MKYIFLLSILYFSLISGAYADSWTVLGPSGSGNYSSYSYGMVPSSALRVYNNGGTSGSYFVQNSSGFSWPNALNIISNPYRYNNFYNRRHYAPCHRPHNYYGGYAPPAGMPMGTTIIRH